MTARSTGVCKQFFAMLPRFLEIRRPQNGQALRIFRERRHTAPGSDNREWSDLADVRWHALIDAHFRSGERLADEDPPDAGESENAHALGGTADLRVVLRFLCSR